MPDSRDWTQSTVDMDNEVFEPEGETEPAAGVLVTELDSPFADVGSVGEEWPEFEQGEEAAEADPELADIAERIAAGLSAEEEGELEFEDEKKPRPRPPYRFTDTDIARVRQAYQDNERAAAANPLDRANCIVMLNVGIGRLLLLKTRPWPARNKSSRRVQMPALTTHTIEKAMAQLVRQGLAGPPVAIRFLDQRGRTAGTLAPQRLDGSVASRVLKLSGTKPGWYAFGLSIMDGYHSVLLLIRRTGTGAQIFWLDQFSPDVTNDVTTTLDAEITDRTKRWWQTVWDRRKVGYSTTVRLSPLRGRTQP